MRDRHRANSCTLCYSIYLFPILVSKDIEMKDKSVKPSGWWQKSHFHKTTAAWDKEQIQTLLFKVIHQTMSGLSCQNWDDAILLLFYFFHHVIFDKLQIPFKKYSKALYYHVTC